MKKYKQLNYEEKGTIKVCLWHKMSINRIANKMGRSPSTISREIKRGITLNGTYFAESAERLIRQRKLNDRRKRKIKKPARKSASLTGSSIIVALSEYNKSQIHTITYDNGCEFIYHEKVNKKLHCKSYFCNPYHSWEKGTVENINRFIRRHFPKGTNFDNVSDRDIQYVQDWFNNRSMKTLNRLSPNQMYEKLKSVAV